MLAECTMTSSRPAVLTVSAPPVAVAGQRVVSLDVLRGFTMLWIVGGAELLLNAVKCFYPDPVVVDALGRHLDHPQWEGFVAWDFIMPLFLFVVGAALPWAMAKRMGPGQSLLATYWRILRRVVVLWVLGMLVQQVRYQPEVMELYSNTLQAIAIGYLVTSVALLHLPLSGQIALFASLVLGYGGLLMFAPFPGYPGGTLRVDANFPLWIDQLVLDVSRRDRGFTWVVTSLGFSATVLLGALAGQLLRTRLSASRKLLALATTGVALAVSGWVWSYWLPLNRHVWTSSMILWTGGLSFLVLAASYAVLDVAGVRRWAYPFVVVGANALLAYSLDPLIDPWTRPLMRSVAPDWSTPGIRLAAAIIEVGALWVICWVLYRRRIFLRA
ncbi:MAG: DUF5009 domain-containing protein [Planctomycetaceae bacterium]|nr:DUF5009 domain-containing protein [Planctomycetaceae bacterium]